MDLKGSLTDCTLRIYPSEKLIAFLETVPIRNNPPSNLLKFTKSKGELNSNKKKEDPKPAPLYLNDKDVDNLSRIKAIVNKIESTKSIESESETGSVNSSEKDDSTEHEPSADVKGSEDKCNKGTSNEKKDAVITDNVVEQEANDIEDEPTTKKEGPYLTRHDVDWLFAHLAKRRQNGEKDLPYLHELLQGSTVDMPENKIMKRNPELEARCVKLRAQQEAREYRQMTKGVDNVRIRYPDDSISYQLKQVNRQLIAVGQFIISIFAGFLFGFKGVEWMIGSLDFGFRLLLGVMCALVIALAEIYFLAKKLNEELNVPETVQLGGPTKFADETINGYTSKDPGKEHQD